MSVFSTTQTNIMALVLLALSTIAAADSPQFCAIDQESGSTLSDYSLRSKDGMVELCHDSGVDFSNTVTEDGLLKLGDGKYALTLHNGSFAAASENEIGTDTVGHWSIHGSKLQYDNADTLYAVPIVDHTEKCYEISTSNNVTGAIAVSLNVIGTSNNNVTEFIPTTSSVATSTSTSSSSHQETSSILTNTANGATNIGCSFTYLAMAMLLL